MMTIAPSSPLSQRARPIALIAAGLVALTAVTASPSVAAAASPEEEAALLLFKNGRKLFDAGKYQEALERFEKARKLVKNEFLTYYLARTFAALNRCPEALSTASKIKADLPASAAKPLAADIGACRLSMGSAALEKGRCAEAESLFSAADSSALKSSVRSTLRALTASSKACASAFDTSKAKGQEAARYYLAASKAYDAKKDPAALSNTQRSIKASPSPAARWLLVRIYDRQNDCGGALKALDKLGGSVPEGETKTAERIETRCLIDEATRLADEKSCRKATRLLKRLEGRLRGSKERNRLAQLDACAPYATEFVTDTLERKAAYKLYVAAKEARASSDVKRAKNLATKAAAMVPDPVVLRLLAEIAVDGSDCSAAVAAIERIASAKQTPQDQAFQRACQQFAPQGRSGAAYVDFVRTVRKGLQALQDGRYKAAVSAFDKADASSNRELWVIATDARYSASQCQGYLDATDSAPAGWTDRLTEFEERREECRASLNIKVPVISAPTVEESVGGGDEVVGWALVGTGGALIVGAAVLGALYAGEASAMSDAAAIYNTVADDSVAAAAREDYDAASSAAELNSGLAWGLGAAGVAAMGIGLWLALSGEDTPPGEGKTAITVGPGPALQGVSLGGRF